MRLRLHERGDTIIEVLFAITVFSLVSIGGLSLMNQGTAMAQRSLEIGLVREQIDAQGDALRYLNRAYIADYGKRGTATDMWNKVVTAHAVDKAQDFTSLSDGSTCHLPTPGDMPFTLDITKLSSNPLLVPTADVSTYAKVRFDTSTPVAEGIWIQAVRWPNTTTDGDTDPKARSGKRPGYYDFHIRACWLSPGQSAPVTLGTIVRLYEPRG